MQKVAWEVHPDCHGDVDEVLLVNEHGGERKIAVYLWGEEPDDLDRKINSCENGETNRHKSAKLCALRQFVVVELVEYVDSAENGFGRLW